MIKLGWYVQDKVAIIQLVGDIAKLEITQMSEILYDWYEQSPNDKVHLIVDDRYLTKMPDIASLTKVKIHSKRGWVIIVAIPNKTMEFIASMAVKVSKSEIKFVDTMPEALEILKRVSPNLSDLSLVDNIQWLAEVGFKDESI